MSLISTQFSRTASAIALATAALAAPFNSVALVTEVSDTAELKTHPLVSSPGISYWGALRNLAKDQTEYALVNQAYPADKIVDVRLRSQAITAGFEGYISQVFAVDVANISAKFSPKSAEIMKQKRYDSAFPLKYIPAGSDLTPYDMNIMAVVPKVGQEQQDVPFCMELPQYDANTQIWGARAVIATGRITPQGDLFPLPWNGEKQQLPNADGKVQMACMPFALKMKEKLDQCAAAEQMKNCLSASKDLH